VTGGYGPLPLEGATMDRRQRILIIGGGPAGLSAAYHLTNQPGWQDRYEVTVHQLGWRLGGKGATGRDPDHGWRVQEHGIHGFTGFYDTTFRMLADCYTAAYGEDGQGASGLPGTMTTAFRGMSNACLTEVVERRWVTTPQVLPVRDGLPWVGPARLHPREALVGMLDVLVHRHRTDSTGHDDLTSHLPTHRAAAHGLAAEVHDAFVHLRDRVLHAATPRVEQAVEDTLGGALEEVLDHLRHAISDALLDEILDVVARTGEFLTEALEHVDLDHDTPMRIPLMTLDFVAALLRGLLTRSSDGTRLIDRDLDEIDHLTHHDWLRAQGATEATVTSAMANATANILFCYPDGDTSGMPMLSAATFVGWVLRSYCILGETYYLFPAGTGEIVIRPLYLALRARGVRFEFFSRLEDAVLSDDGSRVERLRMQRQVEVAAGPHDYDPLVEVPGRDFTAWPAEPVWEQLVGGAELRDELRRQGTDLESWWCRPSTATTRDLVLGEDFDLVVWAIPPATLPYVGRDLLDRQSRWATLHDRVPTTATLALQVWLDRPASDLGGDGVEVVPSQYVSPSWPSPLIGVGEFTDVLAWEAWPDPAPQSLLYACGPLADLEDPAHLDFSDTSAPARAYDRVLWTSVQWLRTMAALLPGAGEPVHTHAGPQTPDFGLLHAVEDVGAVPERRVATQWMKANVDPPERYTQAPPGSAAARFDAWDTGIDNLVAAGDWIRTGVNAGCFEGAVLGGALASHALTGYPALADLPDYAFGHPGIDTQTVAPRLDTVTGA
jgi:uncharacterized protein with NAD-binding domain and iron-sulfur cluster